MKIYAISDLYLSGEKVKKPMNIFEGYVKEYIEEVKKYWNTIVEDEDIVLISGVSCAYYLKDAQPDLDFIGKLKGKKVMLKGKYDYWWKEIKPVRNAIHESTRALQNDCIREDGVVICGSSGYLIENFNSKRNKLNLREKLRFIASLEKAMSNRKDGDVLIIMMHYPPFNSKLEDSGLTDLFNECKVNKVVYGYLHGQNIQTPLYYVKNNIEYYLTSCDRVNNNLIRIF
jgi:uncharacterized protein